MDPDAFTASLYKWDPRSIMQAQPPQTGRFLEGMTAALQPPPSMGFSVRPREVGLGGLEELFQAYGIRYYTAAKIAELGFTMGTLLHMKDDELDEMMNSLSHIFRWELLVGERYGIKAAVRAERHRLDEESSRRRHHLSGDATVDALSQEGLSEELVQHEMGSGSGEAGRKKQRRKKGRSSNNRMVAAPMDDDDSDGGGAEDDENGGGTERQREHPFIVTEPGEVARGKKNGLDYLFHLYEQCREFLFQVQNIAKEKGEKVPNKVTNQVFRFAKKAGASYINKPKMRHYVHCYALHCLDEVASDALRRSYKERGENVGAWRAACYKPLVAMAARQGWDIDAVFNSNPKLSIWYVPTKLRQLCHAERSGISPAGAVTICSGVVPAALMPF